MFERIMVPIDLAEREKWLRAVQIAVDMARLYTAELVFVSVAGGLQAKVSHSIGRYQALLQGFADEVGAEAGLSISAKVYSVPDPSVEVDAKLLVAMEELGVDLVGSASHRPGWVEHIINSHSGRLARFAPVSVFVVRDAG